MIKDRKITFNKTTFTTADKYNGESIEKKMKRVTKTNEAIESTSPVIYTERKEGVKPEYDIRADKWDIAQKSMGYVTKMKLEARDKAIAKKQIEVDKQAE